VDKHLTLGDYAMVKDQILDFIGEPSLEACFKEGKIEEVQFECACLEKEKGKLVYLIDDEEVENLDVNHIE
ncbi:hypothetical protein KI387_026817, partial [Taxus chinensis]